MYVAGFVAPDNMNRREIATLRLREKHAALMAIVDVHNPWKRPHFRGRAEPIGDSIPGRQGKRARRPNRDGKRGLLLDRLQTRGADAYL